MYSIVILHNMNSIIRKDYYIVVKMKSEYHWIMDIQV